VGDERGHYVEARIQEALRSDERIAELELEVEVIGQTVAISGTVGTPEQHRAITETLTELLPGHRVVNETEVGTFPETDEVERL
jgi:osmotically-inducible protein OsmY